MHLIKLGPLIDVNLLLHVKMMIGSKYYKYCQHTHTILPIFCTTITYSGNNSPPIRVCKYVLDGQIVLLGQIEPKYFLVVFGVVCDP